MSLLRISELVAELTNLEVLLKNFIKHNGLKVSNTLILVLPTLQAKATISSDFVNI
jgi:hypothetical protein